MNDLRRHPLDARVPSLLRSLPRGPAARRRLLAWIAGSGLVLAPLACGDDGSGGGTESTAGTTEASGGGTDATTAGATDAATAGTTDATATTAGTTGTTAASAVTGDPGTTDPGESESEGESATAGAGDAYCVHQCAEDDDCKVNGENIGLTCKSNFCSGESSGGCEDDAECVALFSGWSTPCTEGGGECDETGQACVKTEDGGRCAIVPSDFVMCETFNFAEIEVEGIDGDMVAVCAQIRAECGSEGYCLIPCKGDTECASEAYPVCNVNTGICGCGSDADCAILGLPEYSVCHDGICGCGDDRDCIAGGAGDRCHGTTCGCSGEAACAGIESSFDGGAIACVEL